MTERQDDQWQDQGDAAHGKGEGTDDGMKLPMLFQKKEEEGNLQGKIKPGKSCDIFQCIERAHQRYPCQTQEGIADPQRKRKTQHAKIRKGRLGAARPEKAEKGQSQRCKNKKP